MPATQRRLVDLDVYWLQWMRGGELCLHRHGAARLLRSLFQELYLGNTLTAPQTADLLHDLFVYVLEGVKTYAEELTDPDKAWQIELMTDRFVVSGIQLGVVVP